MDLEIRNHMQTKMLEAAAIIQLYSELLADAMPHHKEKLDEINNNARAARRWMNSRQW